MVEHSQQLLDKADVTDVSKAVTEAVQSSIGLKDSLEEVKKSLGSKMGRQECLQQFKSHQSMIEEIRKQEITTIR